MNKIVLYGSLEQEFGGPFSWDIKSPREAINALMANFEGFKDALRAMEVKIVRTRAGAKTQFELDEAELHIGMSNSEVHIIPMPVGSKRGGIGKVLLGVALVGATIITAGAAAAPDTALFGTGGALAASTGLGLSYGTLALFGVGIALSGLAQMMAPSPDAGNPNDAEDEKASFLFNGPVNVSEQGHPIPLVYGRMRTGSVVASAGIIAEDVVVQKASSYSSQTVPGVTYPGAQYNLT